MLNLQNDNLLQQFAVLMRLIIRKEVDAMQKPSSRPVDWNALVTSNEKKLYRAALAILVYRVDDIHLYKVKNPHD